MSEQFADALAALIVAGILVCWAPGLWPVAVVEIGAFALAALWILLGPVARLKEQPVPAPA